MSRIVIGNRYFIQNIVQKSLQFNGTSDFALVPITPLTTGFSLGIWLKYLIGQSFNRIISWEELGTNGLRISGRDTTVPIFKVNVYDDSSLKVDQSINVNFSWNFYCITFKPNQFKYYRSGVQQGITDTLNSIGNALGQTLTLGKASGSGSNFFKGFMKNFTFQNTTNPWTQQQIDDLYWRNIIPSGALQWSMNDTNLDQNGENALTLTGTSYSTDVPPHMKPRISV